LSHETYPDPIALSLSNRQSAADLFQGVRGRLNGPLALVLDRELVIAIVCPRCGERREVMRPRTKVRLADSICPVCEQPALPEMTSLIDENSAPAREPLARLGIPADDIVRVDGGDSLGFFRLDADRDYLIRGEIH
jgi:adenylyltransferase/sulfurtransferase